jgi:predicted AlkP superfamily phosphohydrolase/phosphomutase
MELTRARIEANEHLLDTTDWRFASLVYVATDRVQHCLAKYVSPDHPNHEALAREPLAEKVRDVYRLLDEAYLWFPQVPPDGRADTRARVW